MNRIVSNSIIALTILLLFVKCNKPEPKAKTIENLKAAYTLEITESAQYAACAKKTRVDGMDRLSVLFSSAAKARQICADNYKQALEEQGASVDTTKGKFEIKTTLENLRAAVDHETHGFKTLYPEFAEIASDAEAKHVEQLFTWEQELKKRDILYFTDAIKAVEEKTTNSFYTFYLICPRCGNIYYPHQVQDQCGICSTKKEKFIPEG